MYINDIVDGFVAAAHTPGIEGEDINLGTGVPTTVRKVAETISEIIHTEAKPLIGALPDRHSEETRKADIETTYKKIGWKAAVPLKDGLTRTIDWYFKHL